MNNLLLPDGSYSILPRLHANGTRAWYPSTAGGYWGRRIRFPGSTKVYDWSDGQFKTCTPELCPKAQPLSTDRNVLVNYAPFFAEGGESYSVRATASDAKKEIMKEFFGRQFWFVDYSPCPDKAIRLQDGFLRFRWTLFP